MNIEDVNDYINNLYSKTTELSKTAYKNKTALRDFTPTIDTEVARFLDLIIGVVKPEAILEIGTSIGYSTTTMAKAVKAWHGKITTIEYDRTVAKQAQENFKREMVDDVIELQEGDARIIVPTLEGPYDLIFQDADKNLYPELYEDCLQLLSKRGIFIADDTLFPIIDLGKEWKSLIPPIEKFNAMTIADQRVKSTILPIGDGVTVIVRA